MQQCIGATRPRHGRDRPVEDVDRGCGERMAPRDEPRCRHGARAVTPAEVKCRTPPVHCRQEAVVEVTRRQALALRMASLLLRERPGGRLADVAGVVTWLGAMQAQDLASGLWSFG